MSSNRRFFALTAENSIFKFRIDTSKIVSGATNGSQNPLTFKIPMVFNFGVGNETTCIIKVSDGRPDISVENTDSDVNAKSVLTFSTAGIYDVTIIGKVGNFVGFVNASVGYDRLKIIGVYNWGKDVKYQTGSFNGCSNCVFYAENTLKLPSVANSFFADTAGFYTNKLDNIIFSDVTSAVQILRNTPTAFNTLFNAFMPSIISVSGLYTGVNVTNVSKVEIISDSVTDVGNLFNTPLRNFSGELIIKTPNNTNIQALQYYFNTPVSMAKVDIRSVTNALNFIRNPFSQSNTDATLLGWVNNFDWSGIAPVANKVTLDFKNSKYSNNASVIAAKTFLESKGIVFTRLTMA